MNTAAKKAFDATIDAVDTEVEDLSKPDYRDVLEALVDDLKARLDEVEEELEEEE